MLFKTMITGLMFVGVSGSAVAGDPFVSLDYDVKHKQHVATPDTHHVYGLTVGQKFDKLSVGIKMENEVSDQTQHNEGLVQAQASYDVMTVWGFTPFVNGAVGEKYKSGTHFSYYVAGAGLKYALTDNITLVAASRLRSPFTQSHMGYGDNLYRTVENSIGVNYAMTKNWVVSGRYKNESGDSDYNTFSAGLTYKF